METRRIVDGRLVLLEEDVPALDDKHVRVQLEVLEDDRLPLAQQNDAWRDWVESGPQGRSRMMATVGRNEI